MSAWRECTLGDVLTLQRGFDLPNPSRRPGTVPIVSSAGVSGTHDEAKAAAPGVVIGRYGTLGQVHFLAEDYWPLNTTLWVKDFKGNDPRFCCFLMQTLGIAETSGSSAVPGVNRNVLHLLPVIIPPLPTQRRIASILSAYDDLIEVNRRRIAVLEEMARGLFEEWFVRFRFPAHEEVTILDTPDGPLPEGWCRQAISTVYDGMYDGPHATPPLADAGATFLGIGNITETGRIDLSSLRYIAEDDLRRWTKRVTPQEGDIVFTYEATLNRYALIPKGFRGCLGRRLALIRCSSRPGMNRYLYHYFFTKTWREVISKNKLAGATVERVPLTRFPEFPIIVPPSELLRRFDEIARPISEQTEAIEASNRALAASRDLLLPRLISGQLSIIQAERELEKAA